MSQEQINAIQVISDTEIKGFFGDYRFLSNFQVSDIEYEGLVYPSTENAYQAMKTLELDFRKEFTTISPSKAKQLSRKIKVREDWNEIKLSIMRDVTILKYQNEILKELLLCTEEKYLEETNWWNDTFWGVCKGVGENNLGKVIMEIRNSIK